MRVLVQRSDTGQYYTGTGWVRDPRQAQSFAAAREADEFCATQPVGDFRIILKFPEESNRPDIIIPIRISNRAQGNGAPENSA